MYKKLLFLFLVILFWIASRSWIKVKHIECYTQYGICSPEISDKLSWLINTPLLYPLPQKSVNSQLREITQIKSTRLYRRLPATIVVSVYLRKPIGALSQQVLGAMAVIDQDGVVINHQENAPLPQLLINYPPSQIAVGEKISNLENKALQILFGISSISGKQVLGRLKGNLLETVLPGGTQVLIDLEYTPKNWTSTLHLILSRSKIQSKVPKTIDLRFTSPVLTY